MKALITAVTIASLLLVPKALYADHDRLWYSQDCQSPSVILASMPDGELKKCFRTSRTTYKCD